jgi:hypothetical protein
VADVARTVATGRGGRSIHLALTPWTTRSAVAIVQSVLRKCTLSPHICNTRVFKIFSSGE